MLFNLSHQSKKKKIEDCERMKAALKGNFGMLMIYTIRMHVLKIIFSKIHIL